MGRTADKLGGNQSIPRRAMPTCRGANRASFLPANDQRVVTRPPPSFHWPLAEDGQHIRIISQIMLCQFSYALLSLGSGEGEKGIGILCHTIERNH